MLKYLYPFLLITLTICNLLLINEIKEYAKTMEQMVPIIARDSYKAGCLNAHGLLCKELAEEYAAPIKHLMELRR